MRAPKRSILRSAALNAFWLIAACALALGLVSMLLRAKRATPPRYLKT